MVAADTLRTAETLREAGMSERQASATARGIAEATGNVVTREYLDVRLRAELAVLERRLVLWAVGVALTVGTAAVGLLLRLLPAA